MPDSLPDGIELVHHAQLAQRFFHRGHELGGQRCTCLVYKKLGDRVVSTLQDALGVLHGHGLNRLGEQFFRQGHGRFGSTVHLQRQLQTFGRIHRAQIIQAQCVGRGKDPQARGHTNVLNFRR
ncbi:MAG: hypothetical protein RLZZ464_1036 [Pseudomonadota bacterium]